MQKLVLFLTFLLGGTALFAFNAEKILLFHFDGTKQSPADAGEPRLKEVVLEGLVLWVAPPKPGKPTILYFHGNAGNLAGRVQRFNAFLDQGFGVVAMAYPGSSGSIGAQTSENIQKLAMLAYTHLPKLTGTGPIVIYGESLGTGVALQLAVEAKTPPAALILESPYTSILDRGRQLYPKFAPILHWLGDPWISRDWIAQTGVPLLILHGSLDRVIPTEMGHQLFALSPSEDKVLHIVEGAGHHNIWQVSAQQVLFGFLGRF